jgi:hypothetical protein
MSVLTNRNIGVIDGVPLSSGTFDALTKGLPPALEQEEVDKVFFGDIV